MALCCIRCLFPSTRAMEDVNTGRALDYTTLAVRRPGKGGVLISMSLGNFDNAMRFRQRKQHDA